MPGRTQNYQFLLPLEEEYYSIDVVNETTEAIDSQLKRNMDALDSLRTELEETLFWLSGRCRTDLCPLPPVSRRRRRTLHS